MENTVAAGDNYWQVIDDRPEASATPEGDLSDCHDTREQADTAYAALPGAGRLMSTHDDGRSDQFDWQLGAEKSQPSASRAAQHLAGLLPEKWQNLTTLPEPICEALLTLAIANQGGGYDAIQANLKLEKLAGMTAAGIEAAYAQRATA